MAPGKASADFNAIINAGTNTHRVSRILFLTDPLVDRQRRQSQALAQEIFGRGRRQSAPGGGGNNRKSGAGAFPSLASRVGIAKVNNALETHRFAPLTQFVAHRLNDSKECDCEIEPQTRCRQRRCRMDARSAYPEQPVRSSCASPSSRSEANSHRAVVCVTQWLSLISCSERPIQCCWSCKCLQGNYDQGTRWTVHCDGQELCARNDVGRY